MLKREKFTRTYMNRPVEDEGMSDGTFIFYKIGKGWRINHRASGTDVFSEVYKTRKEAQKVAGLLCNALSVEVWQTKEPFADLSKEFVLGTLHPIRKQGITA